MKKLHESDIERRRQISERVKGAIGFESVCKSAGSVALIEEVQSNDIALLDLPPTIVLGEE